MPGPGGAAGVGVPLAPRLRTWLRGRRQEAAARCPRPGAAPAGGRARSRGVRSSLGALGVGVGVGVTGRTLQRRARTVTDGVVSCIACGVAEPPVKLGSPDPGPGTRCGSDQVAPGPAGQNLTGSVDWIGFGQDEGDGPSVAFVAVPGA
jgi:hypothetical protein